MYRRILAAFFIIVCLLVAVPVVPVQAQEPQLRVAFNKNQAPYHFVDERGNPAGLHIDMLRHIAENIDYELELLPLNTSTECMEAMQRGEVDAVIDITNRLDDSGRVSETLSEEIICIVSPEGADASQLYLNGMASVQVESITPTISVQLQVARRLVTSDQEKTVAGMVSGGADIAVVLKESALYYLEQMGAKDQYEISNSYVGTIAFALQVAVNDRQLLRTLNKEIAHLRVSDTYSEMRKTWDQPDSEEMSYLWMKRLLPVLAIILLLVGLYAVIGHNIRRALHKQVEKQTLELQKANQEISRHLEQLEAESDMRNRIIRYSYLAMVLFDEAGRVLLLNKSADALLGKHDAETGKDLNIMDMPVVREIVKAHDTQKLFDEAGDSAEGVRTIVIRQEEKSQRYRYSLQRIFKGEKVWAALLVMENITDEEAQRNAKFEEEKNRTLNQVVAGIAHEIKNPLTSIKTFVKVLETAHADPQFMQDFSRYVPAEVERINRLVESLISYAKPTRAARERVDLTAVAQEVAFFAESGNQNKRIRIISQIEDGQWIMGNRDQIKQILINIVINGKESMEEKLAAQPDNGELMLQISLCHSENGSVILIRDEGMGMSAEAVEQSMNPFFTTKKTGTGLGLTLSRQFAKENNGELTITSEVGEYTQIRIEFRREQHEGEDIDR